MINSNHTASMEHTTLIIDRIVVAKWFCKSCLFSIATNGMMIIPVVSYRCFNMETRVLRGGKTRAESWDGLPSFLLANRKNMFFCEEALLFYLILYSSPDE